MVISFINGSYRTYRYSYVTKGPFLVNPAEAAKWRNMLQTLTTHRTHGLGFRV